jgi:hypothetical protein
MRIYHPELDIDAHVDPEAFPTYALRGWVDADAPPPPPAVPAAETQAEMTRDQILESVGDNPLFAAAALEAEQAGKNRKTLVAALERIIGPHETDPGTPTEAQPNPAEPATTEAELATTSTEEI